MSGYRIVAVPGDTVFCRLRCNIDVFNSTSAAKKVYPLPTPEEISGTIRHVSEGRKEPLTVIAVVGNNLLLLTPRTELGWRGADIFQFRNGDSVVRYMQ